MSVPSSSGSVPAIVMNLFYTGLGIARSLGERGVPVFGLTAHRQAYGNRSRYVTTVPCADSAEAPERLLDDVLALAQQLGRRGILFPTRDSDLVFLERYRARLEPHFDLVVPSSPALALALDKNETFRRANTCAVASPRSWAIGSETDLLSVRQELVFPAIVKPLAAYHWRTAAKWELVGGRKAIAVNSFDELLFEYRTVARADARAIVQELIPGDDDRLFVVACYVDRQHQSRAAFNAQKLIQCPPGLGTGCILQTTHKPVLLERTARLLRNMDFSGVAEVEYKWDQRDSEFKLIEVNPRPWDQHRLGAAVEADVIYAAYCDHAGLPLTAPTARTITVKWVAEDALMLAMLRLVWHRQPGVGALLRQARGRRIYGIWAMSDPMPFIHFAAGFLKDMLRNVVRALTSRGQGARTQRQKSLLRAAR